MNHNTDRLISAVGLLCLAAGLGIMFISRYMGLTLIAIYLVIWILQNFPRSSVLRKESSDDSRTDGLITSFMEKMGEEIDRAPEGVVIQCLAGIELGLPVEKLENNPAWKELAKEEKAPLQSGLLSDERVYGHLRMNLLVSVRDEVVWRVSFAHRVDERLRDIMGKIHDHYGTVWENGDGRTVWEDGGTRLEFVSKSGNANLVLSDLTIGGG